MRIRTGILVLAAAAILPLGYPVASQAFALTSTAGAVSSSTMQQASASGKQAGSQAEQPVGVAATEQVETAKVADENDAYLHSPSVRMFGKMFGMTQETAATAFQLLNFLVLLALVIWFLARSLPKVFGQRASGIRKQLVDARRATEEAKQRMNSVEQRLAKLDDEIAAIGLQAEKTSEQDAERLKAAAEDEKNKIVAAAEQEIAAAAANAQRQIRQFAAELAIDQAAQRIAISAETDRLLVQSFAGRLIGDDKAGQN